MLRGGRVTAVGAATAIVVGLVVVTPAAGYIRPASALAIGAIGAFPSYIALIYRAKTKLDDSLDVVAAHGLGGATGAILTGVLPRPRGAADPTVCSVAIPDRSSRNWPACSLCWHTVAA